MSRQCEDCVELTCLFREILDGRMDVPLDLMSIIHLNLVLKGRCAFYHREGEE